MSTRNIQIFHDTVLRLLRRGATKNIEKMINRSHAADIAHVIEMLDHNEDKKKVFNLVKGVEGRADVLKELDTNETIALIEGEPPQKNVQVFQEMSSDKVADIIGNLPQDISDEYLKLMEPKGSEVIEELLRYPEDTAGGIMTPDFYALPKEITVGETIQRLQKELELEHAFYVYIINKAGQLVGVLSLRKLIQVKPETKIEEMMITDVISVQTDTDQEEVAKLVARYNLVALPVVDESNKLVGIVTVDEVVDVIRDEATEDIMKMGGVGVEDVLENPSIISARLRIPWLFVSLLGGVIAFKILGSFQATLESLLAVVLFIPVMMGVSGNVAIQSSTIVARGLSTGKIQVKQIGSIIWKELKIGVLLGLAYGVLIGLFANYQLGEPLTWLACVVGGSLAITIVIAALVGVILPMIFERFHVDPAFATGPFVSSIVDIIGIFIYLRLATLFHGIT